MIVKAVHEWLRANRLALPKGDSEHPCIVAGIPGKPDFEITLTLKTVDLPGDGKLHVRRQQVADSLGAVIERVLTKSCRSWSIRRQPSASSCSNGVT